MADLGNLMFRMGLSTKDFEKQMQDELALAKKTADEIKKAFADIKLPTAGGKGGKGGSGGKGGAGGVDNDELKASDDLYKKLANRIAIVNEQISKLRINSRFGYNGQYVQDAIKKLEDFREKLQSGILSGSKSVAQNTMKLFSNYDYAKTNKEVENLIREGDKYNRSLDQQAAAQKKAYEEQERQKVTMGSLTAQYNKLSEAINKVNFAQSHTNKSGVNAGGMLTNNARTGLLNAQSEITRLINLMNSGGSVSRSQIQVAMEGATRAIRESSTAIQQQRAINTEAQRANMQGQAQILARQRAINAAQAENARLIARSNSHFSIMRNLVGQVGSMMGMYFSAYALQNFISDLVRIRGEFDMQYTALKAILQSGQQASELFSQLKTLAPISPYQFKDLATYAKQLSAYSIPYNELFDTTKRLADLSSGLGVDFYRIVLAYGQVRSAAVLRGQELRQFTEAGIPMVDELAKKFTKLKGEVVSAGDVFELISERQVPFEMVKEVIDDLTNEGGKFYMMQEKQSETLKGKVSNLADRYDIMMNSLGEANDGVLKGTVDALAAIMEHANLLVNVITKLAVVWGAWKLATTAQTAVMGKNLSVMTAEEAKSRAKQTNLLREAELYRKLTAEERKSLASRVGGTSKKLSSSEVVSMVGNGRISQDAALRMAYLGKIDKKTLDILRTNKLITKTQYQQVLHSREKLAWASKLRVLTLGIASGEKMINTAAAARIALYKMGSSLMAGLGAIFSPASLAIAGITSLITAVSNYWQEQDQRKQQAQQLSDDMKEAYDDLRKFIADNPIEIAIKSGDEGQMKEMTKRYVDELRKQLPSEGSNGLLSSIYVDENGNNRSIEDQLKRAQELVDLASQAKVFIQDNSDMLINSAENAANGWVDESLKSNIEDYITEFGEFKEELYGLNKANILAELDKSGLEKVSENARKLKEQLQDGKTSMEGIFLTAQKLASEHLSPQNNFWQKSGFQDVFDEFGLKSKGQNGNFTANGAYDIMESDIIATAKDFKDKLQKALGDTPIDSDYGRMIVSQMKDNFIKNMEIPDERSISLFNWIFDTELYGNADDALIQQAVHYLGGKLSDASKDAVKGLSNGEEWGIAMNGALREACDKMIEQFPEKKAEIERLWQIPNLQIRIKTGLAVQEVEAWKKYLKEHLPDVYHTTIDMASNPLSARKAIQETYDAAREKAAQMKPIALKAGITPTFTGVSSWLNISDPKKFPFLYPMMQQYQKELSNIQGSQWGIDNGIINPDKSDKKDKPKKTGGSQKDKYTDDLKRRYESFKKAIQEYNKAIQSMGEAEAKALVKTVYGIELPDRYIDKYGGIALAEDFEKKNTKKTDTAKNFRETLRNDKTAATVQKETDSYDALAEARMEQIKITEKQYKTYDDLFKKTGDAKLSSIMAFGSETKPYKDIVEYLKSELVRMGEELKTKGVDFASLLKLSPQEMERLPKQIQELFKKIQETAATGGDDVRKQLEDVFNKTDDEDVKIAVNNNLRDNLLSQLPEQMKNASPEAVEKTRQVINDYYNNLNKELNLEKIKKSIDWTQLFGDLTEMSVPMLDRLEKMLQKIVDTNKDLDPEKMKEWVTQLNKVKEANTGIKSVFDVIKSIPERNLANRTLTQTNKEVDRVNNLDYKGQQLAQAYDMAIATADTKTQKDIEQMEVIVQLIDAQGKLQESTMTYSDLLKRQSSDRSNSQALQNAANKASNSFFQGAAGTLFSKIGVKGASAGAGASGAGGNGPSGFAIVDAIVQTVNANLSSLTEAFDNFGIDKDSNLYKIGGKVENINTHAYAAFEDLKQGNAIGMVGHIAGSLKAISSLWESDTQAQYEEEKQRHQELLQVWDTVISRLEKVLDESSTEDIANNAARLTKIQEDAGNSARKLGKQYLNAGAKKGFLGIGSSASNGVKQHDNMRGWDEFNAWAEKYGVNSNVASGRMTGLFDLSVEQLRTLQEEAPTFFASLRDDTKEYINQIIEAGDKLDDIKDKEKEMYTSTTTDAIADSFASALDSMDDQTKTFANNFTKTLRTAIINAYVNSAAMKNKIQTFYDKMAEYAENDEHGAGGTIYSSREWNELQGLWNNLSDDAIAFQSVLKQLGAYSDQTSGSLSGGINSITEEVGDLLASYVNAIRADVAFIRGYYAEHFSDNSQMQDVVTTISVAVANIEANTRRSADNTDDIVDLINAVTKTTSTGKAIRVS